MTTEDALKEKYSTAAGIIVRAGMIPFAPTDTLLEIIEFYLDEEDIDFIINNYSQGSTLSHDQLKEQSNLSDEEITRITGKLAKKGFIFNQPSSKGIVVYRLLPLIIVGAFEYTFMNELTEDMNLEDHKKVAKLYEKLLEELQDTIQSNYDGLLPIFESQPPVDRTVPTFTTDSGDSIKIVVNESVTQEEQILPAGTVEEIINKFDDIAVGHCFCRNYGRMLGNTCNINAPSEVCFSFGKSARYTIEQGFTRQISKEEALQILKKSEEAGLIHKAFHNGSNIDKIENSICNCCKDCCDTFKLWRNGATPMINSTNYLSIIDQGACTGCGDCVERCPTDAISLNTSSVAEREENYCIGCGICARFCQDEAISLQKGMRKVYVPPPRLR